MRRVMHGMRSRIPNPTIRNPVWLIIAKYFALDLRNNYESLLMKCLVLQPEDFLV